MLKLKSPASSNQLQFDPAMGIGFQLISPREYGEEYFNKYVAYGKTTFGKALNSLRLGLVSKYLTTGDPLIDIGVGDGTFVRMRGHNTYGYDINPFAATHLMDRWCDIRARGIIPSASFWDSLEHIEDADAIVAKVQSYCFVSIPVFRDEDHVRSSKHYRPDEHYWYFTRAGLITWFWNMGFVCRDMNDMETALGREDIGTFVFSRYRR